MHTLLPHQKRIHPCPPPQRPHPPLRSGRVREHEPVFAVAHSLSIQPVGANTRGHESPTNVNIVCYPIRKIKHVNLCLIDSRSAVWTFCDLGTIRQMEHQDALKSPYSPLGFRDFTSAQIRIQGLPPQWNGGIRLILFFPLCQSLGDSSTMSRAEKISLRTYVWKEWPVFKCTVCLFKTSQRQ